ncbi:MAG: hypothetical protein IJZ72_09880 [Oscillospiraceae bacterium]|nr:hypothetical protein [Oscillospiraceae bacterium]
MNRLNIISDGIAMAVIFALTPYIGGKDNPLWDQFYDSIACFAYWEVLPEKDSTEEFEETVAAVFENKGPVLPNWCSANNPHFSSLP